MKKLILVSIILQAIAFLVIAATKQGTCSTTVNSAYVKASIYSIPVQVDDSLKAYLQRAQSFTEHGNSVEASKIYIKLMKSHPDNKDAVNGWIVNNMKKSPSAPLIMIKQLDSLEKVYPNNTGILFWKTFLQGSCGMYEEALKGFDQLIKLQPDTAVYYLGKGQLLFYTGKYEDAYQSFEKATSLDPKSFDAWNNKAEVQAKLGKYDDAIESVNKCIALWPDFHDNCYNRAYMYCLKGDKSNALADLKKAIAIDPNFKAAAMKDPNFKSLYDDDEFIKMTAK